MGPDTTLDGRVATWAVPSPVRPPSQAAVRQGLKSLLNENRWTIGGLLLAQAMVLAFYLILVHNVAQAELKRAAAENEARERHGCALIQLRLMRDQCFARLSIGRPAEVIASSPKAPT